jgi:hypothetical protein
MKTFFLNHTLKEQGHRLNFLQRRAISQVLLFDDHGYMYANTASHMYHRKMLKMAQGGAFNHSDNHHYLIPHYGWQKVLLNQIQKVLYRPSTSGMVSTWGDEDMIQLYRAVHIDTKVALDLHPAWMINAEVMELIGKHLTAHGVRSDLENVDGIVLPRRREYGYLSTSRETYPDRKLPYPADRETICLHPNYLLEWKEQEKVWAKWDALAD